ncbi:unnamed protein product, partial [Heligmosomoides polygyrus]|uniref:BDP1 factor n=1 Tax=Heligmosomoides polygyrus TaxID=6339 RepID=A0A183F9R3_HELPZ
MLFSQGHWVSFRAEEQSSSKSEKAVKKTIQRQRRLTQSLPIAAAVADGFVTEGPEASNSGQDAQLQQEAHQQYLEETSIEVRIGGEECLEGAESSRKEGIGIKETAVSYMETNANCRIARSDVAKTTCFVEKQSHESHTSLSQCEISIELSKKNRPSRVSRLLKPNTNQSTSLNRKRLQGQAQSTGGEEDICSAQAEKQVPLPIKDQTGFQEKTTTIELCKSNKNQEAAHPFSCRQKEVQSLAEINKHTELSRRGEGLSTQKPIRQKVSDQFVFSEQTSLTKISNFEEMQDASLSTAISNGDRLSFAEVGKSSSLLCGSKSSNTEQSFRTKSTDQSTFSERTEGFQLRRDDDEGAAFRCTPSRNEEAQYYAEADKQTSYIYMRHDGELHTEKAVEESLRDQAFFSEKRSTMKLTKIEERTESCHTVASTNQDAQCFSETNTKVGRSNRAEGAHAEGAINEKVIHQSVFAERSSKVKLSKSSEETHASHAIAVPEGDSQ